MGWHKPVTGLTVGMDYVIVENVSLPDLALMAELEGVHLRVQAGAQLHPSDSKIHLICKLNRIPAA